LISELVASYSTYDTPARVPFQRISWKGKKNALKLWPFMDYAIVLEIQALPSSELAEEPVH
jgi:hypothetical protein